MLTIYQIYFMVLGERSILYFQERVLTGILIIDQSDHPIDLGGAIVVIKFFNSVERIKHFIFPFLQIQFNTDYAFNITTHGCVC